MFQEENKMAETVKNVWILASRPRTLGAAIAPVLMGTAIAVSDGKVNWFAVAACLFCAVMLQIGANYSNDYFDFIKGADSEDRMGPLRATQAGLVKPEDMRRAFIIVFALAALSGIYLILLGGIPVLVIGIASIIAGILYTGGPYPLGYHGLGDIFVLIFFGFIAVGGTYYVQAGEINGTVLLAGAASGSFSTGILTINNLRDIESDKKAGKRTLAVRFGKGFARMEYLFCMTIPCIIPIVLVLKTGGHYFSLASCLVIIPASFSVRTVFNEEPGPHFNKILGNTGKYLLIYSIIFSAGWII